MSRLEVRLIEGQEVIVGDRRVALGETISVDTGSEVTIREATNEDSATNEATGDVFDAGNRPNGVMSAVIAPKMPKSSGELVQVDIGGGRIAERAAADVGVATQGGGPESPDTIKTPGPEVDNSDVAGATPPHGGTAAATGSTDGAGGNKGTQAPAPATGDRRTAPARK